MAKLGDYRQKVDPILDDKCPGTFSRLNFGNQVSGGPGSDIPQGPPEENTFDVTFDFTFG